ncbi:MULTISPECIES: homocysteine S-methyltransferase family protein [unclassified Halorhodospira]|uniref:homocysteine S-methyltransferase family protein n=1 Tax=unclassified Halorhodospira TaxID=2626748 RepID=UPI001EE95B6D|nr:MULTISPECIES: homocysteine S-methyltransferase family protein [unclassified Halorhodospira]MCG5541607.1 homocysteine S-methyltransferase family protein [Halorhodospira sp. M39old]MCG5544670.1 homocysteine S-methyltransferase family protein [Halorhodospira sp. M38]
MVNAQGNRVVVLDGGMGQELRRRSSRPASPLWSAQVMLEEPELVVAAHRDFIEAGAQVITANTYSATPRRLARDGEPDLFHSLHAAALDAARKARQETGQQGVRIAGCLPPLVASYRPDVAPDDETCLADYRQMVEAQAEGVDLFLCETMSLAREARAATIAGVESNLPVWTAFTVDDGDGTRLRSGESLAEAAREVVAVGAQGVLINCAVPEAVTTAMSEIADLGVPFGAYANAFTSVEALQPGGTVDVLEARKDLDPAAYAEHALGWVRQGASIVGGCCEVGPAHIETLSKELAAAGYELVSA